MTPHGISEDEYFAEYVEPGRFQEGFERVPPLAEQDIAWAQAAIGTQYLCGQGVNADIEMARRWLSLAAESGSAIACVNLVPLYTTHFHDADRAEFTGESRSRQDPLSGRIEAFFPDGLGYLRFVIMGLVIVGVSNRGG